MTQANVMTENIREDMASDSDYRLMFPLRSVSPPERENGQKYRRDRVKEASPTYIVLSLSRIMLMHMSARENEDSRESVGLWSSLLLQKTLNDISPNSPLTLESQHPQKT